MENFDLKSLASSSGPLTDADVIRALERLREHFSTEYEKNFAWPELGSTRCIKAGNELLPLNHPDFHSITCHFNGIGMQGIYAANPDPEEDRTWVVGLERRGDWVYVEIQTQRTDQYLKPVSMDGCCYGQLEKIRMMSKTKLLLLLKAFSEKLNDWKKNCQEKERRIDTSLEGIRECITIFEYRATL